MAAAKSAAKNEDDGRDTTALAIAIIDDAFGDMAVAQAQIADLTPTDLPPGIHLRAPSA